MQIPGYEIIELIGAGATGEVYKARQLSLGRMVAVKVLRAELCSDPVAVAQFRLEANAVANLKHPNILAVYEAGEADGRPFFVMELVTAYSVGQWLQRKGRVSESDALTVADSVARALKYAWHRAGLIHCDIKPDNILIDEDGLVKVADFSGLSRENLLPESELIRKFTIGTPNYMAPEQISGLVELDCRADIYALGALLYHMTTGVLPFKDRDDKDVLRCQISGYLTDPLEICPELSLPMVTLMEKMLVKDRQARSGDWAVVIDDIALVRSGRHPNPPLPLPGASTLKRSVPDVFKTAVITHTARVPPVKKKVWLPEKPPMPAFPSPRRRSVRIGWLVAVAVALLALDLYLLRHSLFRTRPNQRRVQGKARPDSSLPTKPHETPAVGETSPPGAEPIVYRPPESPPDSPKPAPAAEQEPLPNQAQAPEPTRAEASLPAAEEKPAAAEFAVSETHEPAPPAEPSPAEAQPDDFIAIIELIEKSVGLSQKRQFDSAISMLQRWLDTNPDSPLADLVRTELEGLNRMRDVWNRLMASGRKAAGALVDVGMGAPVEIVRIGPGPIVMVTRRTESGSLTFEIELSRIGPADLMRLFQAINTADGLRDATAWAIGVGQWGWASEGLSRLPEASRPALQKWLDLRQVIRGEAEALNAFKEARRLVETSRFKEALTVLRRARDTQPDARVITWARRSAWEELERWLETETEAPTGSGREDEAEPPRRASGGPGGGVVPREEEKSDEKEIREGDTVSIRDLRQRPTAYHGQTIRVRFRSRGSIEAPEPGRFTSTLIGEEGVIQVEFSEEGWRWFNSLPEYYDRGSPRYVYGIFDAERETLKLLGRTRRIPLGGRRIEYGW